MPRLPSNTDADFWEYADMNGSSEEDEICEHRWYVDFDHRVAVCRNCSLSYEITPEIVNEDKHYISVGRKRIYYEIDGDES